MLYRKMLLSNGVAEHCSFRTVSVLGLAHNKSGVALGRTLSYMSVCWCDRARMQQSDRHPYGWSF